MQAGGGNQTIIPFDCAADTFQLGGAWSRALLGSVYGKTEKKFSTLYIYVGAHPSGFQKIVGGEKEWDFWKLYQDLFT